MNFHPEQYTMIEIKKIFNILDGVNFFKEFTLQDVDLAKKRLYTYYKKEYPMREEQIKEWLDVIANRMVEERFASSLEKPQSVLVKNTIKDNLNPNYKNTIQRVTVIDSQYRPTLFQCNYPDSCIAPNLSPASETIFSSKLTDTLNNTISLSVAALNIPFSFYNIDTLQGNNILEMDISGLTLLELTPGYYSIDELTTQLTENTVYYTSNPSGNHVQAHNHFDVSYNAKTGKTTIFNNDPFPIQMTFYDNQSDSFENTRINFSLGWILGFRQITCSGDEVYSRYTIDENGSITGEFMSFIPTLKYFVITADDHNHNQSNKSLVQLSQGKEYIRPTTYHPQPKPAYARSHSTPYYSGQNCNIDTTINNDICGNLCLDTLVLSDLSPWSHDNHQLTRKQIYTRAAINQTNSETQLKIEQINMPNILAIIPFEAKSLVWGQSIFFSDKNKYSREYHGPVDIEKLSIKIYDDKGRVLNLNGQDWSMTLLSKHLYKY